MKRVIAWVIAIVLGIGLLGWWLVFTGSVEKCELRSNSDQTPDEAWQELNLFLEGSINKVGVTDGAITALIEERLDPRVKSFRVCFEPEMIIVSGEMTNRLGWKLAFWGRGKVEIPGVHPQLKQLDLKVGRISLASVLIQVVQSHVNQKLQAIYAGGPYGVKINSGSLTLMRI